MEDWSQKIKRVKPLVKIRKTQLDRESSELARIRGEKKACLQRLQSFQNQYLLGVEQLNHERQSINRGKLTTLERSVETAKSRW